METVAAADAHIRVYPSTLIALAHSAKNLSLRSNRIRSQRADTYRSPLKGRGMEYDESRPYCPGDDVRHLDWRVMARTGEAHTKLFREEREKPVYLWVDYRAPMMFATRGRYKSVVAAELAALLAWGAFNDGDRIGGIVFSDRQHREIRPQRGKKGILHLIHSLAEMSAPSDARDGPDESQEIIHTADALRRLSYLIRPGSVVCLLSDFRGLDSAGELYLRQISAHSETIFLKVYDSIEAMLPPSGEYRLSDGETSLHINTANAEFTSMYRQQFQSRTRYLQTLARKLRIGLLECRTNDNPFEILHKQFGAY